MNFLEMIETMEVDKLYKWEYGGEAVFIDKSGVIYRKGINSNILLMHKNLFLGEWEEIK